MKPVYSDHLCAAKEVVSLQSRGIVQALLGLDQVHGLYRERWSLDTYVQMHGSCTVYNSCTCAMVRSCECMYSILDQVALYLQSIHGGRWLKYKVFIKLHVHVHV